MKLAVDKKSGVEYACKIMALPSITTGVVEARWAGLVWWSLGLTFVKQRGHSRGVGGQSAIRAQQLQMRSQTLGLLLITRNPTMTPLKLKLCTLRAKHPDVPCENTREDIFKEIDILCSLNHENVLFLKEYFEENNKVNTHKPGLDPNAHSL